LIIGVEHLGIAVNGKRLDTVMDFFCNVLGFKVERTHEVEGGRLRLIFLSAKDVKCAKIELLVDFGRNSSIAGFIKRHGEIVHHIALRVDNINETLKNIKDKDPTLTFPYGEEPLTNPTGDKVVFVKSKRLNVLFDLFEKAK